MCTDILCKAFVSPPPDNEINNSDVMDCKQRVAHELVRVKYRSINYNAMFFFCNREIISSQPANNICIYPLWIHCNVYIILTGACTMNYQEMLQTAFAKIFSGMAVLKPSLERVCITCSVVLTGFQMLVGDKTYLVLQKVALAD